MWWITPPEIFFAKLTRFTEDHSMLNNPCNNPCHLPAKFSIKVQIKCNSTPPANIYIAVAAEARAADSDARAVLTPMGSVHR